MQRPLYLPLFDIFLVLLPGGAPAADLKALSRDDVNMNISTFVNLRKDSLRVSWSLESFYSLSFVECLGLVCDVC